MKFNYYKKMYRKEYAKMEKLSDALTILTVIIGIITYLTFHHESTPYMTLMASMVFLSVSFTIHSIDDHERELSKNKQIDEKDITA